MGNALSDPVRAKLLKLRFGSFEVDLQQQELYNRGIRIALQRKPFRMLELLIRKRGTVVSREELAEYLWPNLHVSFDRGLNTVVNVLRRALGDSPGNCRYIETRSGLGYRFIAQVEEVWEANAAEANRIRRPRSFEAYEDYLRARYFYTKMTEPDLRKSIVLYESALKLDPRYAQAYTGLAASYNLLALLGLIPAAEAHLRIREYATAALRIDDKLPEARAALAGVKKWFEWDWEGAESEYRAALELDPEYADGHRGYAALLCSLGRMEDAKREIRRAQEVDPLSIVISTEIAWILYMCRDFRGAMEQSWKALTLEARHAPAQNTLGVAYQQLGMFEDALTELENARICSGQHPVAIAALAHAHAHTGNQQEALRLLQELEEISARRHVSPYWIAMVHAGLGARDSAFESLEQAFHQRDVWLLWLKMEPRFDFLRADQRFARTLERLRMV
jgi:DNA-binding winged helix-turn-helix (wHTH) protein/Flp pilus assembly protein TadD